MLPILTILRSRMMATSFRVGLILVLFTTVVLMGKKIANLSQENNRLHNNLIASHQTITELQSESGKPMIQSEALELRIKELSQLYPQLLDEIKNLKVKPTRVKSISENGIISHSEIVAPIKDSVAKDSAVFKTFSYHDDWNDVKGVATADSQRVNIYSIDTLVQVVYKGERENKWLWFFSPRKLMQRVTLKNPNTKIIYSQVIQLQKRRGRSE